MSATRQAVERVFREESGRINATLIRVLGDFDLAEEAMQDAFTVALQRWATDGVPDNPAAWITTAARRKAVDRLRRRRQRGEVGGLEEIAVIENRLDTAVEDDRLRLIFTCCHPALNPDAQVALTLRTLGGLTTSEIARAFLVPVGTLARGWFARPGRSATLASRFACRRITSCPIGFRRCWRSCTSSSTRGTRRRKVTIWSARTCPARRSAWRGCSQSSRRMNPRRWVCLR